MSTGGRVLNPDHSGKDQKTSKHPETQPSAASLEVSGSLLGSSAALPRPGITPERLRVLQRTVGNQAVGQLAGVQVYDRDDQADASFQSILLNKAQILDRALSREGKSGPHGRSAVIQRQEEEEEVAQMKPSPAPGQSSQTSAPAANIQRENGDGPTQQQQQLMAPVQAPDDARRENWEAVRRAVHTVADGMQSRVETLVMALEEIASTVRSLPISGPAYNRALREISASEAEITSALVEQMEIGMQAAATIDHASDAQMTGVMADAGPRLAASDEAVAAIMREVITHANRAAHIAAEAQAGDAATVIMAQADTIHEALVNRRTLQELIAARAARGRRRDVAAQVVDVADVINNLGAIASGIAGIIELLGVQGASGGAVVGGLGGSLGILFGAIGLGIGLYGIINGAMKRNALKKIAPSITNDELKTIKQYAQVQKEKTILGGIAVGIIGAAAIGAGILGLIAISAATFGAAAIVAGIGVALLGLGLVAYKIIHSRSKRKAERHAFAEGMVEEVRQGGPKAAEFSSRMEEFGLDPDDAQGDEDTRNRLINNLSGKVGDLIKSQRQKVAESLINFLINGKPSEQFDAELIIKALGRDPEKVRQRVRAGDVKTEVSRLMGKLSSW